MIVAAGRRDLSQPTKCPRGATDRNKFLSYATAGWLVLRSLPALPAPSPTQPAPMPTVLTLFGTRPEIIKLAPVIHALERRDAHLRSVNVSSSQHTDLLRPFVRQLKIRIDHDLEVMTAAQSPADVLSRVVERFSAVIARERPDFVLVQGDTTTAMAGAMAACYARIPVGHVEAGLRTGDRHSPFPEEINRRVISQLVDLHFAATRRNLQTLVGEGIARDRILLTGNPVVDSLQAILKEGKPSADLSRLLNGLDGRRLIVLTTHRRENAGEIMAGYLRTLRAFVDRHPDVAVVFPVHPNPAVRAAAAAELDGAERIHPIAPLEYADFVHLLSRAWLIASDSGGIQEEAPTLGKPVLILRDTTERPEVLECGIGRLVGHDAARFRTMLEEAYADDAWAEAARTIRNPFGNGDAGERIAAAVQTYLNPGAGLAPKPVLAAAGRGE